MGNNCTLRSLGFKPEYARNGETCLILDRKIVFNNPTKADTEYPRPYSIFSTGPNYDNWPKDSYRNKTFIPVLADDIGDDYMNYSITSSMIDIDTIMDEPIFGLYIMANKSVFGDVTYFTMMISLETEFESKYVLDADVYNKMKRFKFNRLNSHDMHLSNIIDIDALINSANKIGIEFMGISDNIVSDKSTGVVKHLSINIKNDEVKEKFSKSIRQNPNLVSGFLLIKNSITIVISHKDTYKVKELIGLKDFEFNIDIDLRYGIGNLWSEQ